MTGLRGAATVGVVVTLLVAVMVTGSRLSADLREPWRVKLDDVDEAVARHDAPAALRAWHLAYRAADESGGWDALANVAETYRHLGAVFGQPTVSPSTARRLYVAIFERARLWRSLDGVLSAVEGLIDLGDRAAAERCLRVAEQLAMERRDDHDLERVRAFWARLAGEAPTGPGPT